MIDILNETLPIVIYLLLIVLLVVGIVIGIKLILTMNKVDMVIDDIHSKVKSLDKIFSIIDFTTDRVSMLSDVVINFVSSKLKRLFGNKKSKSKEEDEDDE
jgi:uncharacterized metal-binding protein